MSVIFISYGAAGVWVGTRFLASVEAQIPQIHKDLIIKAGYDDIIRTHIFDGKPVRLYKTPYVAEWYDAPFPLS